MRSILDGDVPTDVVVLLEVVAGMVPLWYRVIVREPGRGRSHPRGGTAPGYPA